jgi:hypothetical protein
MSVAAPGCAPPSPAAALDPVRTAIAGLLRAEHERALARAYERGYGAHPGDEGWAEDAAAIFDAVAAERGE